MLSLILMAIVGGHIGFAGAAYTDRPHVQVLSTPLPLFYHRSDTRLQLTAARHVGALKNAITSLETYYNGPSNLSSLGDTPGQYPGYPYPSSFTSIPDGVLYYFTYKSKTEGKLVFEAKLDTVIQSVSSSYGAIQERHMKNVPSLAALLLSVDSNN